MSNVPTSRTFDRVRSIIEMSLNTTQAGAEKNARPVISRTRLMKLLARFKGVFIATQLNSTQLNSTRRRVELS